MPDQLTVKTIVFKVAGALAAAWAIYWLYGSRQDMVAWLAQGEYSNVAFTVLVGLGPIAGWLQAALKPSPTRADR